MDLEPDMAFGPLQLGPEYVIALSLSAMGISTGTSQNIEWRINTAAISDDPRY